MLCAATAEPTAEAARGCHPGFPRFNVLAGGPGSLAESFGTLCFSSGERERTMSGDSLRKARETLMALLHDGDIAAKVDVLGDLVLNLLVEVEALRRALLLDAKAKGVAGKQTTYGQAYRSTALLSHDAAGPSGGLEKLLAMWLGDQADRSLNGARLRELAMLKRLGYSEQELEEYVAEAESYEMRT